jgi:hypothetical protein
MNLIRTAITFALTAAPALAASTTLPTTLPSMTAVTQPTAANLEVHEWAVFVVDAATGKMNPQGIVTSTLPTFVTDHRFSGNPLDESPPAAANPNGNLVFNGRFWMRVNLPPATPAAAPPSADSDLPGPVGVIRVIGNVDSKVDVSITAKSGSFLGSWPRAEDRSNQLLWRDLSVGNQPVQSPLVDADHWFTGLRSVSSAYLSLEHGGNDRFLLYDLETPYSTPLKARAGKDFSFEISNPSSAPLHDLTLYEGDHDRWRTASIGELASTAPLVIPHPTTAPVAADPNGKNQLGAKVTDVSADPARAKNWGFSGGKGLFVDTVWPGTPATGKLKPGDVIVEVEGREAPSAADFLSLLVNAAPGSSMNLKVYRHNSNVEIQITLPGTPVATRPASTLPSTRPTTAAAVTGPVFRAVQLTISPSTQPSDLAAAWQPIITTAGVDPTDANVMTHIIARYAFDPHRLTAVYRMDDAELNRLLPIEVVPQPAKITRFALVIVVNADPAAGTIVDDMIKQLGNEDWNKRDAAYRSLAAMGPAATAKLTAAKNDKDLEVSWRAEKLLSLTAGK